MDYFVFVFLLFFMAVELILAFHSRIVLLNVLFGMFGIVLGALTLGSAVTWELPFHPWFELLIMFMSVVTILVSVRDV